MSELTKNRIINNSKNGYGLEIVGGSNIDVQNNIISNTLNWGVVSSADSLKLIDNTIATGGGLATNISTISKSGAFIVNNAANTYGRLSAEAHVLSYNMAFHANNGQVVKEKQSEETLSK